jgi:hypothetical protein
LAAVVEFQLQGAAALLLQPSYFNQVLPLGCLIVISLCDCCVGFAGVTGLSTVGRFSTSSPVQDVSLLLLLFLSKLDGSNYLLLPTSSQGRFFSMTISSYPQTMPPIPTIWFRISIGTSMEHI